MTSQSTFASLVLFVKKANKSLRFYIDYYKLNALIKNDLYSILYINKFLNKVSKAKVFTKLDIRTAFNQIQIDLDLKKIMTF